MIVELRLQVRCVFVGLGDVVLSAKFKHFGDLRVRVNEPLDLVAFGGADERVAVGLDEQEVPDDFVVLPVAFDVRAGVGDLVSEPCVRSRVSRFPCTVRSKRRFRC